MKKSYVLKTFLTLCASIAAVYISSLIFNDSSEKDLAQTFQFQTVVASSIKSAHKHPIYVQIHINDEPSKKKILSACFDAQLLPLKPSSSSGDRGTVNLQTAPGTYLLSWKVENDKNSWPKTKEFHKSVAIDKTHLWLNIEIKGESITLQ